MRKNQNVVQFLQRATQRASKRMKQPHYTSGAQEVRDLARVALRAAEKPISIAQLATSIEVVTRSRYKINQAILVSSLTTKNSGFVVRDGKVALDN